MEVCMRAQQFAVCQYYLPRAGTPWFLFSKSLRSHHRILTDSGFAAAMVSNQLS